MAKIDELKALAADLRKRLKAVDQLTGRTRERDRDAQRKRDARAAAKEVQVPPCQAPARRARLEADDTEWLRYYFHELFWYPFTTQQLEMIEAIRNAIRYGGDQAVDSLNHRKNDAKGGQMVRGRSGTWRVQVGLATADDSGAKAFSDRACSSADKDIE